MAATKGNRFWEARAKHGRDKIFTTPEAMWEAACEYFRWCEDHPLWDTKVAQYQAELVALPVKRMRAATIEGLCLFLHVNTRYFAQFEARLDLDTDEGKDFSTVINSIKETIKNQKFTGAAAGLLNANIIARDLGLRDVTDHTSSDGSMSQKSNVIVAADLSDDDLAALIKSK